MSKSDEQKLAALVKKNAAKAAKAKKKTRRQYDKTLPPETDDSLLAHRVGYRESHLTTLQMTCARIPRPSTSSRERAHINTSHSYQRLPYHTCRARQVHLPVRQLAHSP
jgi:hypothetical protein